jgi:hypothetical protein
MPRIDPAQLLQTLSVLLGPSGGIKSTEEVTKQLFFRLFSQLFRSENPNLSLLLLRIWIFNLISWEDTVGREMCRESL